VVGLNGAGKTTLFNAISSLVPYTGTVKWKGQSLAGETPAAIARNGIVQCPETRELFGDMSVRENLDLGGQHLSKERSDKQLDWLFGLFPILQSRQSQAARTLSGGEQQMLAIARALMMQPKLLILDEPTLGLDILARRGFYDALVDDYMDETRTILITTHQVEEVENLLTDVIFIDKGRIVLDCSLEEIATRFAAVEVAADQIEAARAEKPFYEHRTLGKSVLYFEEPKLELLGKFGTMHTPSVSDLFVAKLSGGAQ
jgi:ABC-type branched-subunit amino acid transport system ATPase component